MGLTSSKPKRDVAIGQVVDPFDDNQCESRTFSKPIEKGQTMETSKKVCLIDLTIEPNPKPPAATVIIDLTTDDEGVKLCSDISVGDNSKIQKQLQDSVPDENFVTIELETLRLLLKSTVCTPPKISINRSIPHSGVTTMDDYIHVEGKFLEPRTDSACFHDCLQAILGCR